MPDQPLDKAFSVGRIGQLELRNRFIKTATYEGMCPKGIPSDDVVRHHAALARGGVGLTTLAYCSVCPDGRTFEDQLVMRPEVVPRLRDIVKAVHAEGAAISIQLGHCGSFSRNREVSGGRPAGPSFTVNLYGMLLGLPFGRAMGEADIGKLIDDFGDAAALAREAGFDAVELHLGHGYLLSQFLSPASNRRRDRWGGSLEGRLRLPLAVVERVRHRVGPDFPIIAKMNLRDGFWGGLGIDEAVVIAQKLEAASVDAIEGSGGFTARNPMFLFRGPSPLREMVAVEHDAVQKWALRLFGAVIVRGSRFSELYFLEEAKRVRQAVKIPVILLGGVVSRAGVERAMREGFDFVAMGRALIADPDFVHRLQHGKLERSRCDACNKCIAEMDREGGVRCVLDDV
jgi:2,4-dienoyl-CoA reductase-like NADH-dependent reductase (Old Yellow Enzyme family)